MNDLIQSLAGVGLSENEAKVYLACLELKVASVQNLSKKSGVKRTTIYFLLDHLQQLGLMSTTTRGDKLFMVAEAPLRLQQILEEKSRELASNLAALNSLHNQSADKPSIRFYQGVEGLKQVYEDTLQEGRDMACFVGWKSLAEFNDKIINRYIKERVKRGIRVRALADRSQESVFYQKKGVEELRELRFLPKNHLPFHSEVNIYGNKVATLTFNRELLGVIIESQEIANTWRMVFELLWGQADTALGEDQTRA
ncbi:MAG: hypothetical protein HY461_03300 [Parcubacteria group bacterium]|nr:hypothetical protein [Parcubacteria group bacterium]